MSRLLEGAGEPAHLVPSQSRTLGLVGLALGATALVVGLAAVVVVVSLTWPLSRVVRALEAIGRGRKATGAPLAARLSGIASRTKMANGTMWAGSLP